MTLKWIYEKDIANREALEEKVCESIEDIEAILCDPTVIENSILLCVPGKEFAYSLEYGY